jgi:hypothetical protein
VLAYDNTRRPAPRAALIRRATLENPSAAPALETEINIAGSATHARKFKQKNLEIPAWLAQPAIDSVIHIVRSA